jgi:CheY-like chemotaxis protein
VSKRPSASARILIVDDDENVARVLRRALHEHDVAILLDARDALEKIRGGERFDVILCDVMMPHMSGARLYQELARHAPGQAYRMIFVTAGATTQDTQDFVDGSGQPILEKPISSAHLREEVRRFLDELGPRSEDR